MFGFQDSEGLPRSERVAKQRPNISHVLLQRPTAVQLWNARAGGSVVFTSRSAYAKNSNAGIAYWHTSVPLYVDWVWVLACSRVCCSTSQDIPAEDRRAAGKIKTVGSACNITYNVRASNMTYTEFGSS